MTIPAAPVEHNYFYQISVYKTLTLLTVSTRNVEPYFFRLVSSIQNNLRKKKKKLRVVDHESNELQEVFVCEWDNENLVYLLKGWVRLYKYIEMSIWLLLTMSYYSISYWIPYGLVFGEHWMGGSIWCIFSHMKIRKCYGGCVELCVEFHYVVYLWLSGFKR